jgi:peptidoglycan/LPS O-acetylase OafA/YrhL
MPPAAPPERPIHLPGLNAIRFYAAFSVLIGHASNNFGEMRTQPSNYRLLDALVLDPQSGVNLFFVLSGFLITYLLLREHARTGGVSVWRFYARRILRIWPLYYAVLVLGLVVLPLVIGPDYPLSALSWPKRVMLIVFLPNFLGELGPLSHLWSIGLEEQFYLAWPWAARNMGRFLKIALGVVLVKILLTPVVMGIGNPAITNLFLTLRFECMAIGALGAYFYECGHPIFNFVRSWAGRLAVAGGFIFLAVYDVPLSEPVILLSSVLFLLAIVSVVSQPRLGRVLDTPVLDQLGKVSYGIYLAHYPVIYLVVLSLYRAGVPAGPRYDAILYAASIAGTLGLAFLSYYGYERHFLKLKDRFAVVKTRG